MAKRTNPVEPKWILVFVFFVCGLFAGGLGIYLYTQSSLPTQQRLHLAHDQYQYVNPTIATEPTNDYGNYSSTVSQDVDLKIRGLTDAAKSKNEVTDISIYFRDFETGRWLASNANMSFSPGILTKTPMMIAYYKLAENNPAILDASINFNGTFLSEQDIFNTGKAKLVPGLDYKVDDLIRKMLRDSDETAAGVLFDHIDKNVLAEVFSDLGVDFNEDKVGRDFITLKRYSVFFRALYNGTYLTLEYSEKALELLAQDKTDSLLQRGLPQSIPFVGHVGGRNFVEKNEKQYEVYECDIIYYPKHNYMLCAAAHGSSLEGIKKLFTNIGAVMYSDMAYRYAL